VLQLRAALVAINTRLQAEEVGYILDHSGAKVVVVDPELAPAIPASLAERPTLVNLEDPVAPAPSAPRSTAPPGPSSATAPTCDRNLLELKLRHPHDVVIHIFTKKEEFRTGADWEWWFVGLRRNCFSFRVQAKVIDPAVGGFPHLHYCRPSDHLYQTDVLIKSALLGSYASVPLVCLYTYWPNARRNFPWQCGTFPVRSALRGCSVASAFAVRHLRPLPNSTHADSVLPVSRPWHCLVCCQGYGGSSLPERAASYWRNQILTTDQAASLSTEEDGAFEPNQLPNLFDTYSQLAPSDDIPLHVSQLMEGAEVQRPDRDLHGLIVIREPGE
jgi:hypothetical protein